MLQVNKDLCVTCLVYRAIGDGFSMESLTGGWASDSVIKYCICLTELMAYVINLYDILSLNSLVR